MNSHEGLRREGPNAEELGSQKDRVERVHSLVGPRSFATPEKLVLQSGSEEVGVRAEDSEWISSQFPKGSRNVIIQRGDKGFGIIMVEGKVRGILLNWEG